MLLQSKYLDIHFPHDALDIRNIPVLTRFLTATYLIFSAALWAVRRRVMIEEGADASFIICPLMQLVPGMVIRYPISIFVSNLVDTELWKFIVDLLNLVVGGSYIERCWNSPGELFRYMLVVGSCINIVACIAAYIASMFSSSVRLDLAIDGNYTMLIGFAIAYKQLIPETTIFHVKNVPVLSKNFRFKMLPIFIMCVLTVVEVLWYHRFVRLITIWSTFFGCWTYLRFYQVIPSAITGTVTSELVVGDASETFQLIYFFPDLLKPILRPVFDSVYRTVICRWNLRRPFGAHDIEVGNMVGVSRVMPADVEIRRKQLALEVLEQHISNEHDEKVIA